MDEIADRGGRAGSIFNLEFFLIFFLLFFTFLDLPRFIEATLASEIVDRIEGVTDRFENDRYTD
jgi:hypothetical protein